jgi:acetoacetyl-CoA synthetase
MNAPFSPNADSCTIDNAVARLTRIWQEQFDLVQVTADDDFFELGGDSLAAVGLFLEIEREFGRKLPMTTIYDAPTIRRLAEQLVFETAPCWSPLVCLKAGDPALPPLFIVHGIGGTVIEFAKLAAHISCGNSVYALQARGLDGMQTPLDRVEDMAAYYAQAIRDAHPKGPYLLSGYSFGGLVAVELARTLKAEGADVESLILIDAYAHPQTWPRRARFAAWLRRAGIRLSEVAVQPRRSGIALLLRTGRRVIRRLSGRRETGLPAMRRWLGDPTSGLPQVYRDLYAASERALGAHYPKSYDGRTVFLRAEQTQIVFPRDPRPIWRPLLRSLRILTVPGDHRSMVQDHYAELAACLSGLIQEASLPEERATLSGTTARFRFAFAGGAR